MTSKAKRPTVFFTAFEPSGDDLGAAVAAELRRRDPDIRICALGADRLRAAGAEIIEDTGHEAVMGIPGPGVIAAHLRQLKRVDRWMREHNPVLHVAVDSPAANFPICKISRRLGVPVCHLAAPQLWAWAPWRIRKLRRLTDKVLCLLPFEPEWFSSRGVPATFIGHPVFDQPLDADAVARRTEPFQQGKPNLALLPGSRPKEHFRNFPLMLETFRRLRADRPDLAGRIAAVSADGERRLRSIADANGGWPDGLAVTVGDTEAVIAWADACLTVSGTVSLHIMRQARPMVIMFKASRIAYELLGRWLIYAEHLALPNLLAGKRIVPELMPYFGDHERLLREATALLDAPEAMARQREDLAQVRSLFDGMDAAAGGADAILELLGRAATPADPAPTAAGA
ncbi:MAG: lipid-A-disaccharide synthase [Phycisphaerales bacterium]